MALAGAEEIRLSGRVSNTNEAPLGGTRITLVSGMVQLSAITDRTGMFTLRVPAYGEYKLSAEREGYFRLRDRPVTLDLPSDEISLVLEPVGELLETVEVTASPPGVDMSTTDSVKTVTGTQILEVPYPATHSIRNATRLLPNVVRDNSGGLHISGGSESQTLYTLDGFMLNDPLTGRFESRLSVESVSSMELITGRVPADLGKGSAGALTFRTRTGDDRLRYSATNFFPGLSFQKGFGINDWTPRFNVSGPIRRGRAWLSDSMDLQYKQLVIEELPAGGDRTRTWRGSNLLNGQFNITPAHILTAGLLTNFSQAPRSGLGVLDPPETTTDRRSRQWFFRVKDQMYFGRGALVELGYASNRTFGREIPQGHELLLMYPNGRRGNAFLDAVRNSSRDQWIANAFLPSFTAWGGHQLRTGVDFDIVRYSQRVRRTGYERYRQDGTRLDRVVFLGPGNFSRSNFEASGYVQDSWKPRPGLLVEAGFRQDWDQLVDDVNISPRIGVAWSPPGLENTKISAGYGVLYDPTSLRIFTRPLDQYSVTMRFNSDGRMRYGPAANVFSFGRETLKSPRYQNSSIGLEQRLPWNLYARADYLRRRGSNGFTYINALDLGYLAAPDLAPSLGVNQIDALFELGNSRRDAYDAVEFTVRQTFRQQYEWLASYSRSRTLSTAAVDVSVDDPIYISDNFGPVSWDTPNRLLSWGLLPLPRTQWALAYLLEFRDGFPFSVQTDEGAIQGPVNSYRFPFFLELNLHLERRFERFGHRWAGRIGLNNITDRYNPNGVNNNLASPYFMQFHGGQSRALNFRIRYLGRARK